MKILTILLLLIIPCQHIIDTPEIHLYNRHPLNIYENGQILNISAKKTQKLKFYFYFKGKDINLQIHEYGIGRIYTPHLHYKAGITYKISYYLYKKGKYELLFLLYNKKKKKYVKSFKFTINNY